jgi:hypothetical protein
MVNVRFWPDAAMSVSDPKRTFSLRVENGRKWKYATKPAAINSSSNIQ